jgi:hypothetical protein
VTVGQNESKNPYNAISNNIISDVIRRAYLNPLIKLIEAIRRLLLSYSLEFKSNGETSK